VACNQQDRPTDIAALLFNVLLHEPGFHQIVAPLRFACPNWIREPGMSQNETQKARLAAHQNYIRRKALRRLKEV
jgi:hypothetical protein